MPSLIVHCSGSDAKECEIDSSRRNQISFVKVHKNKVYMNTMNVSWMYSTFFFLNQLPSTSTRRRRNFSQSISLSPEHKLFTGQQSNLSKYTIHPTRVSLSHLVFSHTSSSSSHNLITSTSYIHTHIYNIQSFRVTKYRRFVCSPLNIHLYLQVSSPTQSKIYALS